MQRVERIGGAKCIGEGRVKRLFRINKLDVGALDHSLIAIPFFSGCCGW